MLNEQGRKEDTISNRRGFLARSTEFLAAAPLIGYAATNWNKQDQYKVLNLEDARIAEEPLREGADIALAFSAQSTFQEAAKALDSAYSHSYHKSEVIMVPTTDGENVTLEPQVDYYWDVPAGLPGESTVSNWRSTEASMTGKINSLTSGQLIDTDKLRDIAIETKKGNDTARHILTGLVYGSSVTMLWGYEEAIAYAKSKSNQTTYHHERFEETTATQETRRGFIKLGAAIMGAAAASVVHNKIQERLDNGQQRLEGELDAATATTDQTEDSAIEQYFGETVEASARRVSTAVQTAENALLSGAADKRVSNALRSFVQTGRTYQQQLESIAETKQEKHALAYLATCKTVTTQLESAGSADERIATSGAILEGLGVVAAMSLVVVPGRILNMKYPGQENVYGDNEDLRHY